MIRPSSAHSSGVVRISVTDGLCTYRLRSSNCGGTVSRAPKLTMSSAPSETTWGRPCAAGDLEAVRTRGEHAADELVAQLGGGDVEHAGR